MNLFPYYGPIEELHQSLEHYQPTFTGIYRNLFGEEVIKWVTTANSELLLEHSFKHTGAIEKQPTVIYSDSSPIQWGIQIFGKRPELSSTGLLISRERIVVAPVFISAPPGNSLAQGTLGWLESYLRSFTRYLVFACSHLPIAVAFFLVYQQSHVQSLPITGEEYVRVMNEIFQAGMDQREQITRFQYFLLLSAIQNMYEGCLREIERAIYQKLGWDTSNFQDSTPYEEKILKLPDLGFQTEISRGDRFQGKSPGDRLRILINWVNYFLQHNVFQESFVRSFRSLDISKVPVKT